MKTQVAGSESLVCQLHYSGHEYDHTAVMLLMLLLQSYPEALWSLQTRETSRQSTNGPQTSLRICTSYPQQTDGLNYSPQSTKPQLSTSNAPSHVVPPHSA